LRTRPLQGQHECDTPSIAKAGRTWDPLTVPMSAASLPAPLEPASPRVAARRAPQGRLDPVENICKSLTGREEPCAAAPPVGDGRYRRAYLAAARSEGWGQAGARCGQRTMVCAEGGTVRIAPQLCDTWACKVCGPRRVAWLKRQLGAAVERHGLEQFWTLTIWTKTCTPVESFEVATRAWHKLRTRLQQVHGRFSFVWTIEATKQGYAHLHLLTSLPISRRELSDRWCQASGGSFVVDTQPIASTKASNYLAKYCVQQATLRQDPAWAQLAGKRMFSKSRDVQFEPFRTRSEGAGGTWEVWERPYWDAAAKLRSVAPVASERVAGVPSLTVRAAGGLVGGVPACLAVASSPCLVVEPPSEAPARPCSVPNAGVLSYSKHTLLRAFHGGHTGPPRRENVVASIASCMGVVRSAHHPPPGSPQAPQEEKGGA